MANELPTGSPINSLPKNFRPMLAGKIDPDSDVDAQLKQLNYPVICSPKLDGIRTLIHPQLGAVSRSLKPIRNDHARRELGVIQAMCPFFNGLDGELIADDHDDTLATHPEVFNRSTRAVMTGAGKPKLTYYVFDSFHPLFYDKPFRARWACVVDAVQDWERNKKHFTDALRIVLLGIAGAARSVEVLHWEEQYLTQGFEGIMIRDPKKPYKFNRSALTKTQQHLLKMKRFEDAEGTIIGFEELVHNDNPQTADNFGLADRSSHKDNLRPGDTLGALIVRVGNGAFSGTEVRLGSGFDAATRRLIWTSQADYLGKVVTFKYQVCGSKDKPRIPIYKGLRATEDIS